jgi:hypothetical protein
LREIEVDTVESGPLNECHLLSWALFDHDIGSGRGRQVDGGARCSNEELDAVVLGGNGQLVRANLVGSIAISCHAVCANNDCSNVLRGSSETEQGGRHGVSDQGRRNLVVHQLKCSQTRALVVGPCLSAEGMLQGTVGVKRANNAEGCAVSCSGERAEQSQ